jgi:hypothetical protein
MWFVCILIPLSFFLLYLDQHAEAAGSSLVSIIVDHIFLCIKDTGLLALENICLLSSP